MFACTTGRSNRLSLTGPERETVITFCDEDDTATIHTHQRRIITKLKNNPAAELVEDISLDGTAGAVFELPADLISFPARNGRAASFPPPNGPRGSASYIGRAPRPPSVPSEPDFTTYRPRFQTDTLLATHPRAMAVGSQT
jgi:hypothetical protein